MTALKILSVVIACVAGASAPWAWSVELTGAGATFPAPLYQRWAAAYRQQREVLVRYEPVGSRAGIERIRRRAVDFGASDVPLSVSELAHLDLLQFPIVAGGVVPVVHIGGIGSGELKLTGTVLAEVYLGHIRKWNERPIADLNRGLRLPDTNITVVFRSDSSGTSMLWTSYLSSVSAAWRSKVGANMMPAWPVGVGGVGNEGVASYVKRTRFSIGYVEYAYARSHGLNDAQLRNHDGQFVRATPEAFHAAVDAFDWGDGQVFRQMTPDQPGASSWPITGATFLLVPKVAPPGAKTRIALEFFEWALHSGEAITRELGYEPLPRAVTDRFPALWRRELHDDKGNPVW